MQISKHSEKVVIMVPLIGKLRAGSKSSFESELTGFTGQAFPALRVMGGNGLYPGFSRELKATKLPPTAKVPLLTPHPLCDTVAHKPVLPVRFRIKEVLLRLDLKIRSESSQCITSPEWYLFPKISLPFEVSPG